MAGRILITPRSVTRQGHPALQRLQQAGYELVFSSPGKQPGEDELIRSLPGCVGYLAGVETISARVLERAEALRVISRNGVGVDNIDAAAARRLGIVVRAAIGANSRGVAELTLTLMLSLARWVPFGDQGIKAGRWERRLGMELIGKTLGLIGCGHVGKLVAELALGFGMEILAYEVMPDQGFAQRAHFRYAALEDVLEQSDVVSLHCPASPDGRPLLDRAAIGRMNKGVLLINTARSDLIDGAALTAALASGQIAGAALDVFKLEPPLGDPLIASDRVIATPHIGGYTEESVDRAVETAVDNLLAELKESKSNPPPCHQNLS